MLSNLHVSGLTAHVPYRKLPGVMSQVEVSIETDSAINVSNPETDLY